jgi:hypothetical protein
MSGEIDSVLDATLSASPPPRLGRKSWIRRVFGHRAVIMLVINLGFILIMTRLSPYFLYAGNGFANFKVMPSAWRWTPSCWRPWSCCSSAECSICPSMAWST